MLITSTIPDDLTPGQYAWLIKNLVEALAVGCVPPWARWALPPLYASGVRWALPPEHGSGVERIELPPRVYADGYGDCDRLSVWRIAELQYTGMRATCCTEWRREELHALVRLPKGSSTPFSISTPEGPIEDPSKVLGA